MKISLNEIKKYVDVPKGMSTEELVRLIGSRLVEVEGAIDLAPKYEGITVVKVAECEKIPETHLSLCQVDDGSGELTQVVCGAPNVHRGMLTAWIRPGLVVPATYGEENIKLGAKKLRGYVSNGMLAAADELDLGDEHDGIIEIEPGFAKPGDSFMEVFGLDDVILDIENKSLTHRPDCFGIVGFAREVSGILGIPFSNADLPSAGVLAPVFTGLDPYGSAVACAMPKEDSISKKESQDVLQNSNHDISINISNPEICERYCCGVVEMGDADEKSKYLTLEAVFLAKAGMRSVSKIVDVTNVLMLLTGQPLHAFDFDKFLKVGGSKKAKVGVRLAKDGEELQLLDGKTIECDTNDILITSNDVPVALAGAMGGASTEIDASTKRVMIESATFSLYHLRKTQMKHGIFSEAITRFTKGQPAGQCLSVLCLAVDWLLGDTVLSRNAPSGPSLRASVAPDGPRRAIRSEKEGVSQEAIICAMPKEDAFFTKAVIRKTSKEGVSQEAIICAMPKEDAPSAKVVRLTVKSINTLLGTGYSEKKCVKTLMNVGFEVEEKNGELIVTVPYWRTDIHIPEDIIEEIGRLNGFDNIPQTLAMRPFVGAKIDPVFALKTKIRNIMADSLKAHEVLTYSFVSKDLQEKCLEDPKLSYEIVNSLSPELQVFRQSLVPSLLEKVYENLKAGYKDFALFEMNQVTNRELGLDEDGVPKMENHLAMVVVGNYYEAKVRLQALIDELGLDLRADSLNVYEVNPRVRRAMKIEPTVAAFEVKLEDLLKAEPRIKQIQISKFPAVERDVTVRVKDEVPFIDVEVAVRCGLLKHYILEDVKKMNGKVTEEFLNTPLGLTYKIEPTSIYSKGDGYKNISFHLKFSDMKKTLGAKEIDEMMSNINEGIKEIKGEIV